MTAGLTVELVSTQRAARTVADLLATIWPGSEPPIEPGFAWVLARWGNYVALATIDGEPVGASVGVRSADEDGVHLHSHVTGVAPGREGAGIGWALKHHQRDWALQAGLGRIVWTFDPLVTRNAYFNVARLGADVPAYYVDFYGAMTDRINAGDESDRCLASWRLTDRQTAERPTGAATQVLSVGPDGCPVLGPGSDGAVEVQLPCDIVALRRADPALAAQWRQALRAALQPAYARGLRIIDVSRDGTYRIG